MCMLCYLVSGLSLKSKAAPHVISLLSLHLSDHSNFILSLQHNKITTEELFRILYSNTVEHSGWVYQKSANMANMIDGSLSIVLLIVTTQKRVVSEHQRGAITFIQNLAQLHCEFSCTSPCHQTMIYHATENVGLCAWVNK